MELQTPLIQYRFIDEGCRITEGLTWRCDNCGHNFVSDYRLELVWEGVIVSCPYCEETWRVNLVWEHPTPMDGPDVPEGVIRISDDRYDKMRDGAMNRIQMLFETI